MERLVSMFTAQGPFSIIICCSRRMFTVYVHPSSCYFLFATCIIWSLAYQNRILICRDYLRQESNCSNALFDYDLHPAVQDDVVV
jgi:hypothetical protein